MHTVADIIQRLGGSAEVSRETGTPLTTIEGWKEANFVPAWRRPVLLELAQRTDTALSTADFPPVTQRRSRKSAAA